MAIIVEDGSGLPNAQAYCDVAYLDAWMAERGYTTTSNEPQKEAALVVAAKDWIDGQHEFANEKLTETQALEFPRTVFGFPENILIANANAAYLHLNGALLVDTGGISASGVVESESKSVGPLSKSVKYRSGTAQIYGRILPKQLTNLLKPYLANSGGLGMAYRV
jgi:hypothetical protein